MSLPYQSIRFVNSSKDYRERINANEEDGYGSNARQPQPTFGLEATNRQWADRGSAEHLVKDWTQRNPGASDEEKSLDYWMKRAGVKDTQMASIAQIERTMRNRERELELKTAEKRHQESVAASKAAAPAQANAAPEAKPFNPADYAPKTTDSDSKDEDDDKSPSGYLEKTLASLNTNTANSAYEDFQKQVKSRDEKVARGEIDPLTPAGMQDAPAQQKTETPAKWAEYAAAWGYGPGRRTIDPARKASSSQFLDQLRSVS
jgi:hypothetical protein